MMNSLKSLFFIAILAAAAGGVYVALNKNHADAPPPPGACQGFVGPPKIQMPTTPGAISQAATGGRTGSSMPGFPSFAANSPTSAPAAPGPMAPPGDLAPAFVPPSAAPGVIGSPGGSSSSSPAGSAGGAPSVSSGGQLGGLQAPPGPAMPPASVSPSPDNKADRLALRSDLPSRNATPSIPPTEPSAPARPATPSPAVEALMKSVEAKLDEGRLADAHMMLSTLYGNPEVPAENAAQMTRLLDQMAATVIYSRQHLLEPAYRVQQGDTLDRIADAYNVPPQLLARINGIRDPQHLTPGRELKMIRGPFSALVDLKNREITLMLNGRYAGRFPIVAGADLPKLEGAYSVRDKRANPAHEGPGGAATPNDPASQPGKLWIDLGNQLSIQAANDARAASRPGDGASICVGNQDMEDIFGILSVGSRVVIQR